MRRSNLGDDVKYLVRGPNGPTGYRVLFFVWRNRRHMIWWWWIWVMVVELDTSAMAHVVVTTTVKRLRWQSGGYNDYSLLFIWLFILHVTLCCLSDYSYCMFVSSFTNTLLSSFLCLYMACLCFWRLLCFFPYSSRILPVFFPPRTVVFFSYSIRGLPVFFPYSSLLGL